MKKFFLSITLLSIIYGCDISKDTSRLSGKLSHSGDHDHGDETTRLVLEKLTTTTVIPVDSVEVGKDGDFSFPNFKPEKGFYRLITNKNNFIILILDSTETAHVTGEIDRLAETYSVKGSEESGHLRELNALLKVYAGKSDSLRGIYGKAQNTPDFDSISASLEIEFDKMMEKQSLEIKQFIESHPGSLANLAAAENLDMEKEVDFYIKIENDLMNKYPDLEYVRAFSLRLSDAKKLLPGAEAPDFILKTPEGKDVALSSFRGKIIMIDFWASWCKPCRAENPNVVKLYNKYNQKGFEIIGVSLDKTKEEWVNAIKSDGLKWTHVSDLQFWNSLVVKLYGIQGIPQTILVDKDGKIIAKGLRGKALESKLEEIFGE